MKAVLWVAAALGTACGGAGHSPTTEVTVSAAASLQSSLEELRGLYRPGPIRLNFGGSGMLAQQIEQGAPVDVFLSAAPKPMDELAAKGRILPETRRNLLRNQVVLIAARGSAEPGSFPALAGPTVKLIALGEPGTVPAGDYGRQVLRSLRLWDVLQPKLVLAKDVRQVLTYVERGEADAGIVYATDARESSGVRVSAVAPENTHEPVLYPVAVLQGSARPAAARAFVAFLEEPRARAVFVRHGFTPVTP